MKWIHTLVVIVVALASSADAGLWERISKSRRDACAEGCQSAACEPTIVRPSWFNIFNHQRKGSPACASLCCDSDVCVPDCCAPVACDSGCHAPNGCHPCTEGSCCPTACSNQNCTDEGCCSTDNCRTIAQLIHESMTACYARQRRAAIHKLGDRYDCCCHPEIMDALVYALNDSDERVRAKAADEIGDQIRRNRCICGTSVICALKYSLADCDSSVRRQAEEALQQCGYRIVDGCCQSHCGSNHFRQGDICTPASPTVPADPGDVQPAAPVEAIDPVPQAGPADGAENVDNELPAVESSDAAEPDIPVLPPVSLNFLPSRPQE